MPDSLTSEPETTFVCDCEERMREACYGKPSYETAEGKHYCVLHFPGKEKSADFEKAIQRKIETENFNFQGVWFPDQLSFKNFHFTETVDFSHATFGARVSFRHVTFSGAAYFSDTTFNANANFASAIFSEGASFESATFGGRTYFEDSNFGATAEFGNARFAYANFTRAKFSSDADFSSGIFSARANFVRTQFDGPTIFRGGSFTEVDFRSAVFRADADLHTATFSGDAGFLDTAFNATDFSAVTFSSQADFTNATFSAEADFKSVIFNAEAGFRSAAFSANADFGSATFNANANFNFATFGADADFGSATFGGEADFGAADFIKNVKFIYAAFRKEAYFRKATFPADADFSRVTFDEYVRFAGEKERTIFTDESKFDLQFCRIETPEHVSFHMLTLRPHWFVNVDARKFDFVNVEWCTQLAGRHPHSGTLNEEIKALIEKEVETPHRLLAIACWRLADNAEENHRYEEASEFRYTAMDVRERETLGGFGFWRLSWWYWLASGYGERALQAFLVLLGIWFLSASLYNHVGFARWEPKFASESDTVGAKRDDAGAPLNLSRAMTYSAAVMTLQKPEPPPATTAAQTVVLLETILGPVQAALLALAIRRKFMR